MSVNDAFVMDEWQRSQHAERITFLPDGNGDFTAAWACSSARKTSVSASARGATRCWCAMASSRRCSSSRISLATRTTYPMRTRCSTYIDPNGARPHDVAVFTRDGCPFCARAKGLLVMPASSSKSWCSTRTTRTARCARLPTRRPTRRSSSTASTSAVPTTSKGWLDRGNQQARRLTPNCGRIGHC